MRKLMLRTSVGFSECYAPGLDKNIVKGKSRKRVQSSPSPFREINNSITLLTKI
jgi:hypothetical protein